jgi:hypothetical protein
MKDEVDKQTIYFVSPHGLYSFYGSEKIYIADPYANAVIENLTHPFSDAKKDKMTIKKKPSTKRIKPNPGVNAVGSITVQFQLVCGCKMEQRLDYKNTTTKRFRKTLLAKIYPEQPSQKDTQVTGTSFYTLVADPKCMIHHPNPKNGLTDLPREYQGRDTRSTIWLESLHQSKPSFVSIVTDITNAKLNEAQVDSLISVLQGKDNY